MNHSNKRSKQDLSPYLKEIQISKYKAFNEKEKIDFKGEPKVFLIIGNNASGKTAILDGIAKCLSWVTGRIISEKRTASFLEETAINTKNDPQASAHFTVSLGSKNLTSLNIRLSRSQSGAKKSFNNDVEDTENFAKKIREKLNKDPNFVLPLWAYYSADRNARSSKKTNLLQKRVSAYNSVLDAGNSSWNELIEWLELCFDREAYHKKSPVLNAEFLSKKIEGIQAQIKKFDGIFNSETQLDINSKDNFNIVSEALTELPKLWEEMRALQEETKKLNNTAHLIDKGNDSNFELNTFISMMKIFLNNIKSLEMQVVNNKKKLIVRKTDDTVFDITELSQGEKSILIIVGDLVRRMTTLNPHLKNPLETPSVVLIDEIDLHLHPQWQQQIIQKLEKIFPKTQFILTTHSPIVLSSVVKENIFILKKNPDRGAYVEQLNKQSKGSPVDYNLAYYQDTEDHIQNLEEYQYITQYQKLINNDEEDSKQGEELKKKIISHFGEDHPFWLDFQRQLIFKKRKKLLHEKTTKTNL